MPRFSRNYSSRFSRFNRARTTRRTGFIRFRPTMTFTRPVMGGTRLPAATTARGAEIKAVDIAITNNDFSATGFVQPLNRITAGSSFFQRIGRRIELQSVQYNLAIIPANGLADGEYPAEMLRMLLVYDRQTNGATPAIADILQSTNSAGTVFTNNESLLNLNNRDRFIIVRDLKLLSPVFTIQAGKIVFTGTADQQNWKTMITDFTRKVNGLITQYKADSTPGAIGDIATGGLFLVTFGASPVASWTVDGSMRLRFRDQ